MIYQIYIDELYLIWSIFGATREVVCREIESKPLSDKREKWASSLLKIRCRDGSCFFSYCKLGWK